MHSTHTHTHTEGFPDSSTVKISPANAGDKGWIPALGRSPREGHGNPLQHSCRGNPMDRGARWAAVHRVAKSRTRRKQLSRTTKAHLPAHSGRISVGQTGGRDGCQKVNEALLETASKSRLGHGEPTRSGSYVTLTNRRVDTVLRF